MIKNKGPFSVHVVRNNNFKGTTLALPLPLNKSKLTHITLIHFRDFPLHNQKIVKSIMVLYINAWIDLVIKMLPAHMYSYYRIGDNNRLLNTIRGKSFWFQGKSKYGLNGLLKTYHKLLFKRKLKLGLMPNSLVYNGRRIYAHSKIIKHGVLTKKHRNMVSKKIIDLRKLVIYTPYY